MLGDEMKRVVGLISGWLRICGKLLPLTLPEAGIFAEHSSSSCFNSKVQHEFDTNIV